MLYHFAFSPAMNSSSCCYTSSPAFGVVSDLGFVISNRFYLQFPYDIWCWTSFCMLTCYLHLFLGGMSVKVFGPFFNQVVFLLLSFKNSLYVLDNSHLTDMSLANIFSQSMTCLLSLLTLSFIEQKFFKFNEVQLIHYFFQGSCLWRCI